MELDGLKKQSKHYRSQGHIEESNPSGHIMAGGASTEESEPLFVLEPLPELSGVIDTIASANPLLLLAGAGAIIYLLSKVEDPMLKLSYTSLLALSLSFYVTDSLFYSMLFISVHIMAFFLVWSALRWEDVKAALGMDKARILSIISFIVTTWVLVVFGTAIGMPAGPGVVICASATAYLWWTYYSLEPTTA